MELIKIEVATTVTYSIWDSEAQPPNCKRSWSSRESLMSRLIFRDVSVVLICFDVTNRGSFFNCVLWIDQVKRNECNL